jgi:hypothetical protein
MKAYVTTILRQELEVPEGTTREEILDFFGEFQSFRTAFQGVSGNGITIVDLAVVEEEVTELGEESFDA